MCVPVIPACALKVCCYALDLLWLLRLVSAHSLRPVLNFIGQPWPAVLAFSAAEARPKPSNRP